MPKTYSTYEAKARLSELLERVRKGDVVTITHRGEPVAEIRPITRSTSSFARRLDELIRRGAIVRSEERSSFRVLQKKKGALERFLESRE